MQKIKMILFLFMLVYPAQGKIPNPSVIIIKGTATLNTGSELQLKCNIEEDVSSITFKWFKDNNQISDETSQMLTINSITKKQAGVYHCSAKNGTDSETLSSTKLTITVNYLENAVLTISPTSSTINEGDSVTFTCGVDTNLNPVSYSFQKDGNVITTGGNNVFIISKANKSDSALYKCNVSASTTPPLSVTSNSVSLTVNELFEVPTLQTSSNSLNSGESLTLTCRVNTSSSPAGIEYKFWKGTANITSFQSSFTYTRTVQSADSGKYTCEARLNNVEKNSSEVNILVKLSVSVIITPTVEGQNMTIKCNVKDEAAMSFTWKKNDVTMDGNTKDTIVVPNVNRSLVGTNYSCIATSQNSIQSNEASAIVSLSDIHYESSAVTIMPTDINEGRVGELVTMTCNTSDYGNPPAVLAWYRSGNSTALSTGNAGEAVSYTINPITRDSTGNYTCNAKNNAGENKKMFRFVAIDKPDSPTLKVSSKTPTSITVSITPPTYTGNKPITYYMLQYQGDGNNISKNITDLTNLMYNIPELKPEVDYQLRVQAVNLIGAGQFTEFINVRTGDAVKASGLIIKPTDKNEGKVGEAFNMTCYASNYGIPTAVLAWYRSGNSTALSTGNAGEAVSYTIIPVTRDSTGDYICKANNTAGEIEKMFRFTAIDQASGLFFTPSNKHEGKVGEKIVLDCYTSYYGIPSAILTWHRNDIELSASNPGEKVSYTIDVTRNSSGNYTCRAKNRAGEIEKTFPFTATDKPDAPTLKFSSKTTTSITVSITPPAYTGNKPITYYTLQYQGDGKDISKNITDLTNLMYNISELKPAVNYQVRVQAVNVIGAGDFSEFISITTGDAPPTIPRKLQENISLPQEIALSWLKPNPSNGFIITYKLCYIQDTNDGVKMENSFENCTDVGNVTTFTLKGLGFYNGYNVSVSAKNSAGFGPKATLHQILTEEGVPTKPLQFGHDTISRAQEITLSWKKPNPSNGLITNYKLCYIQDTNDGLKVVNSIENCTDVGTVTVFTLKGLGLYNGYNVSVRARNSAAFGPNASQHQIVTLEGVPNEVRIVSSTIKKNSISVTWKRPKHIYGMLHGYTVKYRLSSENTENDVNECMNVTKLSCTFNNLQPFRNYTVIITVFNRLFSRKTSIIRQTLADAPPPLDKDLPDPPADRIEETSFAINILKFKETNGKIAHYDVIAVKRTNSLYSKNPQDIKNNEIKTFVVGRLYKVVDNQLFTVGGGQTTKRKRRALGIPNNGELEKDTTYVVFVRAYVNDNLYQSTKWYTPVKTAESKTDVAMIVGIIVGILIAICLIIIIILFVRSRRSSNGDVEMKEKKRKNAQDQLSNDRDPRIPVAISRFEAHVNMLKANSNYEFSQEYSMISRELVHSYNQSRNEENNIKNRYHNVPSYDDTRVILSIVDDDPHSDFINANFISGFERENEYIAAQGPLPETLFDFWRMVWENDVTSILMLTQLEERGRIKCAQYWPDNSSLTLKDIVITATEVLDFPDHVVRTFHVTRTGQAIERIVKQFHFTAWPDFGVPDDPLALLSFLRKVNNWKGLSQGPIIVHCSAGVGRTGTYITIDTQIKNIKKYKEVSIFSNVSNIREQRCLMVQTEDQYIFIHVALLDYLESGDTEIEANALREHVKKLSEVDTRTGMTALMDEFVKLAKTHKRENFQEANKSSNQAKNRFRTLYPFDDTRVKLTQRPGVDGSDYINANYVDSYATKNYFIATQTPLENTVGDFWRMIWEQNCATIVMLTNEEKDEKFKVHPYWPPVTSLKSDAFIVELGSVTTYGDHVVRELKLTNTDASTSRDVKQFHYTTWPETGSPSSGTGMIELIGQVQKWNSSIDNKIITVHCSAGVGRTGVFIALTNLIERVKTEGVIDLYQTVKKMRQQRPGMVQTPDQYEFCFRALQEYLDSFDLYSNFR
ncbi:receptor-type tyrosine-protein phosphatase S-like isoform X1 [Hydractinia symbiolongicarpus]|uniref:receptor-type tyrosine-protein phosphatase S-like isoform X1 n=2 Tax=Hydractinia symbiolongicarpus TaxID=13093 RepID=UPI0025503E4B|nr:receptor-type tyrosine-protein phosphatase S-like isoform X1 [Hydractinia symbiolongicarpus]